MIAALAVADAAALALPHVRRATSTAGLMRALVHFEAAGETHVRRMVLDEIERRAERGPS